MPETRNLRGGIVPSTSYPSGHGHVELESAIVRPIGTLTRTVTVLGGAGEWATIDATGAPSAYTGIAAGGTKTVVAASGNGVFFRPTGGPITLVISDPV